MRRLIPVALATCLALTTFTLKESPVQAWVYNDAVEYGISLGLPRAWAYRVASCETGGTFNPLAYNRRSGASGLYQFLPSTWRSTPQAKAGLSVFDPYANAAGAAWLYRTYGPSQWACK